MRLRHLNGLVQLIDDSREDCCGIGDAAEREDADLVGSEHVCSICSALQIVKLVLVLALGGMKIGGDVEGAFLLFPDPMGATGGSLATAIDTYKKSVPGKIRKIVNIHLIVTPEYLRKMTREHPDVIVYAIRVDRGLSAPDVLRTVQGTRWDDERGLTDHQYIVPGGGGFGEIMNNALV